MNAVEKWYEVMKSNNLDLLDDLLADDVTFYSPVVFTPQKGKEITKMYLMAAEGVFGANQTKDRASSNDKKEFNCNVHSSNKCTSNYNSRY